MRECIIVGNGPSFNRFGVEAAHLIGTPTFGMNYCGFQPTYFVCVDSDVLTSGVDRIYEHAAHAETCYLSALHEGSSKLYDLPYVRLVSKDQQSFRAEKFMSGLTASYVALKMAYYAGFERVHLWGVDHSPSWDHYIPDYLPGQRAPSADRMRVMEWHYQLAANVYARAGREIINHSDPSRLDMIFRREYEHA
jgi:hypothetical protein